MSPPTSSRALRWGAALWLLRPTYLVVELAVALAATGGYRLVDDTVSDLGTAGSPWHAVMNGAFVVYGVLLAAGAVLLRRHVGVVAAVLLVVAGLSSVAVGLAPVDQDAGRHALAATPLFVAQPVALLVLARVLRERRAVSWALAATGLTTATAAVTFVLLDGGAGSGAVERLALWPVLVALAVVAREAVRPRT